MPNPEHKPSLPCPALAEVSMPAKFIDGKHKAVIFKNEEGIIFVQVARGETPIFSAALTPEGEVNLRLYAPSSKQAPSQEIELQPEQEATTPTHVSPDQQTVA